MKPRVNPPKAPLGLERGVFDVNSSKPSVDYGNGLISTGVRTASSTLITIGQQYRTSTVM